MPKPRGAHAVRHTRRRVLLAAAGVAAAVAGGLALVDGGVVPGKTELQELGVDPSCWGSGLCEGRSVSGTFYSRYRRRVVGYTVGYPEGHGPGARLPLVVALHGYRGDHTTALAGLGAGQAVSLSVGGRPLPPMAVVTVDGGGGYWHPHPGDDPMGMVVHELVPMLRARGLGVGPQRVGAMGISMGGYGAIALAEHYPSPFCCVAAISPAIFATYAWVHYVNPGAYWSAGDFARYDAITHAAALRGIPVRIASGAQDPFHPWVVELADALPPGAVVRFPPGGHTGAFFTSEIGPSLAFLGATLR